MAYFTKEAYEGKKEYAARRNEADKENVKTLTEDQHDALAWLSAVRHKLHGGFDEMWLSESSDHEELWNYIMDSIDKCKIKDRLESRCLPDIDINLDEEDYISDQTYDIDLSIYASEDEKEEAREKAQEELAAMIEKIDTIITDYLENIDEKHGTHYAPTGNGRAYYND